MNRPTPSTRLRLWREILPFLGIAFLPSALIGVISGALGWHWATVLVWGAVIAISYPIQRRLRNQVVDRVVLRWALVLGVANALLALVFYGFGGLARP
ncbi:MAG: hypothetical protein NZ951_06575 [Dehalococcoidia bacterium]|nr:hypothetical protein [Dehalococcoidia bacterium]MDW8120631.1 hypothetical protein [Chloroflexota bacterium]